ncbi:MAG: hypothetical protein LBT53_03925 [Puniceicoccales bacterium]|jgi:hypothetical protein|nr:hypothetical protein [Puniceicoccales bacterium]
MNTPLPPVPRDIRNRYADDGDTADTSNTYPAAYPDAPANADTFYPADAYPADAYPDALPPVPEIVPDTPFKRFWRKFGGDSFLISIGVHLVLFILAYLVIKTVISISTKREDEFVTGAGGGTGGEKVSMSEHRIKPKNAKSAVKTVPKLTVKGASSVSLPEMPKMTMALESGSPMGASSKGFGGGAGGGIGTGIGPGRGNGRNMVSLFGLGGKGANQLTGTLYDLKKDRRGSNRFAFGNAGARISEMHKAFLGVAKSGQSFLDKNYPSAPEKLYASHLLIPPVNAALATAAFNCADKIQAPGWLAFYDGYISPPESGSFRFAGLGDDALLVTVDNDVKLWAPWTQGGMQTWFKAKRDWQPAGAYGASGHLPNLGSNGRYYGSWFSMSKGSRYRVRIVIAECYGGLFSASLLIQQKSRVADENPPLNVALPVFKLAPLHADELKLKTGMRMAWVQEGPNFGCKINGVTEPRLDSTSRQR